jgi:hypothetical protein
MNKKNYLFFRAVLFFAGACLIPVILMTQDIDSTSTYLSIGFALLLLLLSVRYYNQFKKTNTEEKLDTPYAPAANASFAEQKTFYKRMLIAGIIAFAILTAWTAIDLNDLESGAVSSISLWGPLSFIYKTGGYWPTVLALPVTGIISIVAFLVKIKKINADTIVEKDIEAIESK